MSWKASSPLSTVFVPCRRGTTGVGPGPGPPLPTRPQRLRRCYLMAGWTQRPSTRAQQGPGSFRPWLRSSQLWPWRGFENLPGGPSEEARSTPVPPRASSAEVGLPSCWPLSPPGLQVAQGGDGAPRSLTGDHRRPRPIRAQTGRQLLPPREPTGRGPAGGGAFATRAGVPSFVCN